MVFCHTSTRISHRYTHVPFFPDLPPIPLPPHPSACHRALFEFSDSYNKFPLAIYFTYGNTNFYFPLSIHLPLSLFPSSHVHRSVLYAWFSTAALKINSSVPSFRFHIYVTLVAFKICSGVYFQ